MKMNKTITPLPVPLISCLGILIGCALASQANAADAMEDRINKVVLQTVKPDRPGCAILVVDDGKRVFKRAYGIADMETGRPITTDTAFNIASVTKQFTAACIALLVEEGKIALDDDIRKYLPEMPAYEAPIRIRHLIHHISGVRDFAVLSFLKGLPVDETYSESDLLGLLARQKELNFTPGEERSYSNSGYFLLGLVVQRVTGMSLSAFAEKRLFAPLGMTHTAYHRDPAKTGTNVAVGHVADGTGKYRRTYVAPDTRDFGHGGIYTTVEDLSLWDQNFFRRKVGGENFNTFLQTRGALNNGQTLSYAFGLEIGEHRGQRTVSHQGGSLGYNAFTVRFPERKFTVICLANYALNTTKLSYEITDLYLGISKETPPPTAAHSPAPPVTHTVAEVDPAIYAGLAGKYVVNDGAIIPISTQDNRLYVQPPGAPLLELHPKSATEYFLKEVNVQVTFSRDKTGKASKLTWHQNAHHIAAEKLDDRPLRPGQLSEYEGEYYSEELQITYGVYVHEDQLCLRAPRVPEPFQRNFRDQPGENVSKHMGGDWFKRSFGTIEFSRDDRGKVAGFALHSGREFTNLRFSKR
jgi:CubicO group peptidase (beta-lactamase class C family)